MIISRTPFRISFSGGGSDLPSFFAEEEGAVLSTAIRKYMYITINKRFDDSVRLSYSKTEIKSKCEEVEHPIFRQVLKEYFPQGGMEMISVADVPSGTGLGSSSSFTVGLLQAAHGYLGQMKTPEVLARLACEIEIEKLKEPVGKQDQYIAAFGGLKFIRFRPSGEVVVEPVVCNESTKNLLSESCLMFYTGKTRSASSVLKEQAETMSSNRDMIREMVEMAKEMRSILETNPRSMDGVGQLLNATWEIKKSVSDKISNPDIDRWYNQAIEAGAWGGKILGAGDGGFLLVLVHPDKKNKVKESLRDLRAFDVKFEPEGSRIIFAG